MDVDHGLIGRGAAVAALHQALHRARRGAPTVLGIQSAPGMGKTTVIRSFLGRLGRDVTRFSCTAQSELTVPFLPLASLFDGLGIVRRQRLPQATELEPEVDLELFGEVAGAILTTARERTVVLALDDVQWVDDATSRLLSFVSASLADHAIDAAVRVLAILTARRSISGAPASFFDRMTGGPDGRLITLEPLDETSVAELVGRRTGRRLSPSDARSMAEATGGNPLLIELVAGQDRAAGSAAATPHQHVGRDRAQAPSPPRRRSRRARGGRPAGRSVRCAHRRDGPRPCRRRPRRGRRSGRRHRRHHARRAGVPAP